jgi:hypothetical protein
MRTLSGSMRLDFAVASASLQPSRGRNQGELARLDTAMGEIAATSGAGIASITITDYSSIDGRYEANSALSFDRATALSSYLQERYGIPSSIVRIHAAGEDWNGLRDAVAVSNLPYVSEILKVIDSSQAPDTKESLMRRMMGGQIWQRMEGEILPRLPRMDYSIEYALQ